MSIREIDPIDIDPEMRAAERKRDWVMYERMMAAHVRAAVAVWVLCLLCAAAALAGWP